MVKHRSPNNSYNKMVAITLKYSETTHDYEWIVTNTKDPYVLKITTPRKNIISVRNYPLINTHDMIENPHRIGINDIEKWYKEIMRMFIGSNCRSDVTWDQIQMDDANDVRGGNAPLGFVVYEEEVIEPTNEQEQDAKQEENIQEEPNEQKIPSNQLEIQDIKIDDLTQEEKFHLFHERVKNVALVPPSLYFRDRHLERVIQPIDPSLPLLFDQERKIDQSVDSTLNKMIKVCFADCALQPLIPFLWVNANFKLTHYNSLDLHSTVCRENQTTTSLSKVFHPTQNEFVVVTQASINDVLSAIHVDMMNFVHKYDERQLKHRMLEHQLSRPEFVSDMNAIANSVKVGSVEVRPL